MNNKLWFTILKNQYKWGMTSVEDLVQSVTKGFITQEQLKLIVGGNKA